MFRGILFMGLLSRLNIWPAIWVTILVYGSVHLLNGFLTGNFSAALLQALLAGMIGVMLMALRLRTKSLYPAMVIHGLYNFAVFTFGIAAGLARGPTQNVAEPSFLQQFLLSASIPLSLFLYGLWLLRGIGKKEKAEVLS